jgi:hypothetical protein
MATFDIFNDNAFSLSQLSQTIVDIPRVPTMIGDMGLFTEYGINTPTMMIERTGSKLSLVPAAPRGAPGNPIQTSDRKLIPVAGVHLPQYDSIPADTVYGVRAFGSETEVQSMQNVVRDRLAIMKGNLDLTMEYQRVGAIKGQVLDADGTTVLQDMYTLFGFTQETKFFNIATANSAADPKQNSIALKRAMRTKLGGRTFRRVRVLCSEGFFDKLVAHDKMKAAWERFQENAFARNDQSTTDFEFAGVVYTVYEGGVAGQDFIPDGFGYAMPEGVPRMFQTAFCPANYMETVNTQGLPYYAKQAVQRFETGVDLVSQSNPIMLNTLPEAVFKVAVTAS